MRLTALNVSERGECYAIETPYYEGTGVHVEYTVPKDVDTQKEGMG